MTGAIFLDRDGTINRIREGEYVTCREEFHFIDGVLEALGELAAGTQRPIIVVTNQRLSQVTDEQLDDIHVWMEHCIRHYNGRMDGIYVCQHEPEENCNCRKPKPGLFLWAAGELGIDLSQSVMVGDQDTDLQAAWAAGIPETYLVLTGIKTRFPETVGWGADRYTIVARLGDAVRLVLEKEAR